MKSTNFFAAAAAFVLLFAACQQTAEKPAETPPPVATEAAKPDLAQIKSEIQAIENAWADAINKRDINALMAFYADDAVSMANNAPMLSGKAAILAYQTADFAKMAAGTNMAFVTMDVYGDGNVVTETGTATVKDAAGKVTGTGKYVSVFEKRDGKYLCIREIYNSDKKQD